MNDSLGKINHHIFEEFISSKCGHTRPEVSTQPQFGVDVSVVDLQGGMAMALTSDPLSLIPMLGLQESAWLSVHLMANDMATTGFAPMYGQFVLNLPAHFSKTDFRVYWDYVHQFCKQIGLAITGGHTGFIEGQNSTIAGGGTFITIAQKNEILVSKNAQAGDVILVTKSCAMSSVAILAMSFPETVRNQLGQETHQKACELFYETSSLKEALIAAGNHRKGITAMHDVTEGGVLGAIYEMAIASNNGALVKSDALPIGQMEQEVCSLFALDPRYCIGAGSMIITCKRENVAEIIASLQNEKIACADVGVITEKSKGIQLEQEGKTIEMPYYQEDPYWSAFFKAFNNGWK